METGLYTDVSSVIPLPEGDEGILWHRWQQAGDNQARTQLIEKHLPYARAVAAKMYGNRPCDEFEFDEYLQFATVALIESMDRYDPSAGAKFRTFAHHRMAGAILSGLERLSDRQQQISLSRRLRADRMSIVHEAGKVDAAHADQLFRYLADVGIGLALSALLEGSNLIVEENAWVADQNYQRVELRQFRDRLRDMLKQLTEREAQVITGHYLQSLPFEEIAKGLGVSKARVSQLHYQGLQRMRKLLDTTSSCDVTL